MCECRAYGIFYGAFAVADRNHNRSLHSKLAFAEVHLVVLIAMQIGVQGPQMPRTSPFHLDLTTAIARIDIVELLLSAQPRIVLHLRIEELVDVEGQLLSANEEPQVVERRKLVVVQVFLPRIRLQLLGSEQKHRTQLKIIANRTQLIICQRHSPTLTVWSEAIVVRIYH